MDCNGGKGGQLTRHMSLLGFFRAIRCDIMPGMFEIQKTLKHSKAFLQPVAPNDYGNTKVKGGGLEETYMAEKMY